jgi:hypothetical protein
MSFTLDFVVANVPSDDQMAFSYLEQLRKTYYDDPRPRSPTLIEFHNKLTAKYPCLCSYADDEDDSESPWADGPLIDNFANEMGMVAIVWSRADEVAPFVINTALELGITVFDLQEGRIYRP